MAASQIVSQVVPFPQSTPAVRPIRRARQVRTRISYMDAEQLERFLRAAKEYGPREHAMFLFAVAHGARASEIANLRIANVNFKTEQVHIARLKGSLDSTQNLLRVKGNGLFNEAVALKTWLDVRKPDADSFVFNSQKSTRLSRITVFKLFRGDRARRWSARILAASPRAQAHRSYAHGPRRRECFPDPATLGPSVVRFDVGLCESLGRRRERGRGEVILRRVLGRSVGLADILVPVPTSPVTALIRT